MDSGAELARVRDSIRALKARGLTSGRIAHGAGIHRFTLDRFLNDTEALLTFETVCKLWTYIGEIEAITKSAEGQRILRLVGIKTTNAPGEGVTPEASTITTTTQEKDTIHADRA